MVFVKKLFVEITTLQKIDAEIVYRSLHANIKQSHIEIFEVSNPVFKDVR